MLIFFTFVVYLFGMEKTGVEIVGALPKGFPMPTLPDITGFSNIPGLLLSAALIAIVGMTETYSISKIIIYHTKEKVDFEQEFRAQGLANILTSLFQGYPVCGSFSGTSVNWSSGARTGMSIIIFSFFVLLSITVLTPLFYYLPKFILAVIVILAVMKLFKPRQLLEIYRINRYDGLVAFTTFGVSIITKPDTGLIVGVVLALALHLWKTMHTKIYFTVRDKETGYFISIPEEPKSWCDQLFIIKPEGPFIFVNAEQIRDEILHLVEKCNRMKCLIIDMAAVYYMDTSGIEALRDLVDEMERRNIRLILIHVEEEIVNSLSKEGLIEHLEVHETKKEAISSAFNYYLDKSICRECSKNVFNECEKVRVS
jgi:SulP family sulfate permease